MPGLYKRTPALWRATVDHWTLWGGARRVYTILMTSLVVLLWAASASAQRLVAPRVAFRAAPAPLVLPAAFLSPALTAPALAPTPAAAPLAALPPDHRDWDAQVFERMFSGADKGPKPWTELPGAAAVVVGETLVDKRAPGARELLKTLVLPNERPVLGLFTRDGPRVVNGVAQGTHGIQGHRDAAPPGATARTHGGYSLWLLPDGAVNVLSSGGFPADITPRLVRVLRRYYGLTPARESAWNRVKRGAWRVWDALTAAPKS